MKSLLSTITIITLSFATFFSLANTIGNAWTGELVPIKLRQARDSFFYIYVSPDKMIENQCEFDDFYVVNPNNYVNIEGADRMFSMALASVASGKKLDLYINGCDSEFKRPVILHIDISS